MQNKRYYLKIRKFKINDFDEVNLSSLEILYEKVSQSYLAGKLNDKYYQVLKGELSEWYEELFLRKISSLDGKISEKESTEVKEEIYDAYTKGKITNQHHLHLKNELSNVYTQVLRNEISSAFRKFGKDN
jgi:hypothetical protein